MPACLPAVVTAISKGMTAVAHVFHNLFIKLRVRVPSEAMLPMDHILVMALTWGSNEFQGLRLFELQLDFAS